MESGYRILPPFYDRWQRSYGKDFSTLIFPRLLATVRAYRITGTTMVDVACGTGTLALMMARRGWQVFGVDASEGMLAEAAAKLAETSLPVTVLRQDMRELDLPQPVHLATSFFDSLNHLLTPADLAETFRRIHSSLLPGGWFVFDTSNEICFTTLWTLSETVRAGEFTIALDNTYDRARQVAQCRVTVTVDRGSEREQLSETVRERYYPAHEVRGLLEAAGFRLRQCEEFNFTSNPAVGKLKTWYVAEKETVQRPPLTRPASSRAV